MSHSKMVCIHTEIGLLDMWVHGTIYYFKISISNRILQSRIDIVFYESQQSMECVNGKNHFEYRYQIFIK